MSSDQRLRADLDLLVEVQRSGAASQLSLSKRVGVAVGLVNALVRRAVRKGFVKVKHIPTRRYVYYLTPKGFAEKSRLVAAYLEISLDFFRQTRDEYADLFEEARRRGLGRVALAGAGELAEIAVIAASQSEVEIVAIIDGATNRTHFAGIGVRRSLDELGDVDAVVITDNQQPQGTYDLVAARLPRERILAPSVLRIHEPSDAAPAVAPDLLEA